MSKRTLIYITVALTLVTVFLLLSGCASSSGQSPLNQTIDQATPTVPPAGEALSEPYTFIDEVEVTSLEGLLQSDLIIEGTIAGEQTRWITDTTATNAEIADRQARGLPTGTTVLEYQVTIDKVLKGQAPSGTITVAPAHAKYKAGDRAILFLRDISGDPIQAPGQTKYAILTSSGQFRIEKDNTLSSTKREGMNPVVDTYRGKDKSVLEKDIQDLVAKLPKPTKEEILQKQVTGADLIILGTIQDVRDVHFVNSMEKSQQEIDQLLAEGKMPGLVLTDYTIVVDKVLSDKRLAYPRFFPDYKPLQPGQTIIVMRQGGTYKGVTQIEEAGPAFVPGSQEVLFLVGTSLKNYDLPDDGQDRFSTDSRLGRLLIGSDGKLTAFAARGVGGLYGGQSVDQLAQDITEFLKQHPFK